jgi:hypothetical protein
MIKAKHGAKIRVLMRVRIGAFCLRRRERSRSVFTGYLRHASEIPLQIRQYSLHDFVLAWTKIRSGKTPCHLSQKFSSVFSMGGRTPC